MFDWKGGRGSGLGEQEGRRRGKEVMHRCSARHPPLLLGPEGRFSAPWGQLGLNAGPEPTLRPGLADPREGTYIPELSQQAGKRQTQSRGLWGSCGRGWGGCHWNRAPPFEDLRSTLGSSSCLKGTHDHPLPLSKQAINNCTFSHTSPVCYELLCTFFYWAFSIMDNKFIQTFSPSKYTMKYKTGILHYAIKKDKIQYDNNSGSNSNHISMHTSRER